MLLKVPSSYVWRLVPVGVSKGEYIVQNNNVKLLDHVFDLDIGV